MKSVQNVCSNCRWCYNTGKSSYMHKSQSVKLSQMCASYWACMTTGEREISKKRKEKVNQQMKETKKCNTQFRQIDVSGWCDSQQEEQIKAGRWQVAGEGGGVGGEAFIPTLPCCYLAPSLWTGLVWAGLCRLTGAGRPRTTRLKRGWRGGRKRKAWRERLMEEY